MRFCRRGLVCNARRAEFREFSGVCEIVFWLALLCFVSLCDDDEFFGVLRGSGMTGTRVDLGY